VSNRRLLPSWLLAVLAAAVVSAIVFCHFGHGAAAGTGKIVVWNGTLIDGTGAAPLPDAAVVIEDGRITAVGSVQELLLPPDAKWVDAHGGTILPGVIDPHTHFTGPFWDGEDILSPWLQTGVTMIQDLGCIWFLVPFYRVKFAELQEPPRVQFAGPIIAPEGGYPNDPFLRGYGVDTVEEARAFVSQLIEKQGVDLIKIAVETGYETDYYEPGLPVLTPEQVAAITEEAHSRGVIVVAHATGPDELRIAVDNGVDVAAHAPIVPVPDSVFQDAIAHDVIMIGTAYAWDHGYTLSRQAAANAARYWQLGGRIAIGTDYPFSPPSMPFHEFELLSDAGIPNLDLIVAATKNSAAAIDREADLGTLEVGKIADVIVVAGDPLADIGAMMAVESVILGGEIVKGQASPDPTGTPTPVPMSTPTPTRPPGVGGAVMLPPAAIAAESGAPSEGSGWPAATYAALASAVAGAAVAVAAGGWYARRRRYR